MEKTKTEILSLITQATKADTADTAMKFAQAALNAANAYTTLLCYEAETDEARAEPIGEGWYSWRGGEMPVAKGTLVDVTHRDGDVFLAQRAGEEEDAAVDWNHSNNAGDLIFWRLSPKA